MTPLLLLVGFLGAGKTTYLRELLPALRDAGLDAHVIINDYQNARVDAELLRDLAATIRPISGSCVCCGSRDELLETLARFDHQPGRVLLIETNGTTDAEELIELLSLEPALDAFTLPIPVSIIDGQRWQKRFWHNRLELEQARPASFLHVSRAAEVGAARLQKVRESLAHHGITAAETPPADLAPEIARLTAAVQHLPGRARTAHPAECDCGHDHDHDHGHHHDHEHTHPHNGHDDEHHFASVQIELPALVARESVARFLAELPPEVLRVKGLARLKDQPDEFHVFQRVETAPVQWLPIGPTSRIEQPLAVLIGPRLDAPAIRALAARLLAGS